MFNHYTYIHQQHHVALEAVIRNHGLGTDINAVLLAQMYKLALDGLKQPVTEGGFFTSSLRAGNVTLSSVTAEKTGLWIQLAKLEDKDCPLLTLGQKWAMERYIYAQNNYSSVFW